MHPGECLNCKEKLSGNYCSACGQSAHTHRLSLKHFLLHDLLHGILHLDKGILYSLKLILLKPGKTAKDYIEGKRTGHFNIAALLLLLAGLYFFVSGMGNHEPVRQNINVGGINATEWIHHNGKWILLSLVPLLSLASLPVFRRAHYNYAEHLLVNSYFMVGFLLLTTLTSGINKLIPNAYLSASSGLAFILEIGFLLWTYWQTYESGYSIAGWLWRFCCMLALWVLIIFFVLVIVLVIASLVGKGLPGIKIDPAPEH